MGATHLYLSQNTHSLHCTEPPSPPNPLQPSPPLFSSIHLHFHGHKTIPQFSFFSFFFFPSFSSCCCTPTETGLSYWSVQHPIRLSRSCHYANGSLGGFLCVVSGKMALAFGSVCGSVLLFCSASRGLVCFGFSWFVLTVWQIKSIGL